MALSDYSVLFTSVGRRVEFIEQMTQSLQHRIQVITSDKDAFAPALSFSTKHALLPAITEPDFPGRLLDVCQAHQISHVFPLIDTELAIYASIKKEMALFGVQMVVSDRLTIDLSRDKYSFATFLQEKSILTPEIIESEDQIHPLSTYCARPRFGSRSVGMKSCSGSEASKLLKRRDMVLTKWIHGKEFSIDIIVDGGKAIIVVPRERNLIRDGESIIGITHSDTEILKLVQQIVTLLPGLYGPICLQVIKNDDGLYITELNARFGGGITLSEAAGAGISEWIASKVLKTNFVAPEWENNKKMYRYLKGIYT